MNSPQSNSPRDFALQVVEKLQSAGFQALWAGGCVRDEFLNRIPKDYDVATNATPDQVREVLGKKRTFSVGEAFGVILLRGPRSAGEIEIATFRRDVGYSDGRRPDRVEFTSAEEDAKRRDFTINGMFFDPIARKHLDYVSGQDDLKQGLIRAIGNPVERFNEDKLRMLRAVRFAATFGFEIESETLATIQDRPGDIQIVSGERIVMELRRMLEHPNRALAFQLLCESGLLQKIFPELDEVELDIDAIMQSLEESTAIKESTAIRESTAPSMALALAIILKPALAQQASPQQAADVREFVRNIAERVKLCNADAKLIEFVLSHESLVQTAPSSDWPQLQRILTNELAPDLLAFAKATASSPSDRDGIEFCQAKLRLPREVWDPPALLDGNDLKSRKIPGGRIYKQLLTAVRDAQLLGKVNSKDEAWSVVDQILADNSK